MKILQIIAYFAPAWAYGGPPKVAYEISKGLVERGHSVTVYTTDAFDATSRIKEKYCVIDGIEVYYLKNVSNWLAWNQKIFLSIGLRKLLKKNIRNFDLILLSDFRNYLNILGFHYAKKNNIPYILSAYGSLPRQLKRIPKVFFDLLFGCRMLRGASKVLAQTRGEAEKYKEFGVSEERIEIVPPCIDLSEFRNLPEKGNFRRKYSISDTEKMILFLGRIHKAKGIDLLLRAFSQLIKSGYRLKLAIVGRDDGYFSTMDDLIRSLRIENQTIFTGPLYGKDRLPAYVDADVFVLPASHYEETSVAALEACAASIPVIVTKQASIPWLADYQAGLTIDHDQKELIDALLKVLTNQELRINMGRRARRMVEEKFEGDRIINQLERIYEKVIYEGHG